MEKLKCVASGSGCDEESLSDAFIVATMYAAYVRDLRSFSFALQLHHKNIRQVFILRNTIIYNVASEYGHLLMLVPASAMSV